MGQSSGNPVDERAFDLGHGSSRRVSRGIMQALERREIVPGQRLGEIELAVQFGVGRNAVREAIQWLAAHGAIDLSRHRSAAIRKLDLAEALEVLDVADPLIALMARRAAQAYQGERHGERLRTAMAEVQAATQDETPGRFARGRRHLYNAMLEVGANRELSRLFPALGLHVLFAQYETPRLQRDMAREMEALGTAVSCRDADRAEALGRVQTRRLRGWIAAQAPNNGSEPGFGERSDVR